VGEIDEAAKIHCWAQGPNFCRHTNQIIAQGEGCQGEGDGHDYNECEVGSTCMLPAGHPGPHEWTRNDHIVVIVD
jgi:hypothetical protein